MSKIEDYLKKDTNVVSRYQPEFVSYTDLSDSDNFIDVVDVQNGTQKAIQVHKKCEPLGIWLWDDSFPETLEEFVLKLYKEHLLEE